MAAPSCHASNACHPTYSVRSQSLDWSSGASSREGPMAANDLAFFTTAELIAELVQRTTFCGVVVQSVEEHRRSWEGERTFRIHLNQNLSGEEAGGLLSTIAASLSSEY